jgi:uncharacterized membrane protein
MTTRFEPLTLSEVSFGNLVKKSWEVLKTQWIFLLGVFIVMMIIQVVAQGIQGALMEFSPGLAILTGFALTVFSMVISMGWVNIYIKAARGQTMELGDIFAKYPTFLTFLISSLLVSLLSFIGFIFFIVPGIIIYLKYLFVPYLVIDKEIGVTAAFKASSQMTDGIKWRMIGYIFGFSGLCLLGFLALFVGVFVAFPLIMIAYAVLYNALLEKVDPELLVTPNTNTVITESDVV